ncbi:MAG: MATE family efflux transporter [Deltaproteobacteria bacterium]|nr:MATE family efflux transporter [Deltaproteobacteria bacterium]
MPSHDTQPKATIRSWAAPLRTRFFRNVFSNAGATALSSGAQLVLVASLSRLLDTPDFAVYIGVSALVGVGEMASDFGGRIWATQRFAVNAPPRSVLARSFALKLLFTSLLALGLAVFPFKLLAPLHVALAILIAATQASTDPLLWYLLGRERLDLEAGFMLASRLVTVAALSLAAWMGLPVQVLLLLWLGSNLLRMGVESLSPPLRPIWSAAGQGAREAGLVSLMRLVFPIGAAFFAMTIYQRLGVLMLESQGKAEAVALFGAAFSLVAPVGFLATSITISSFTPLARALGNGDAPEALRIINRGMWLVLIVMTPVCLAGVLLAPWIIALVYPAKFAPAAVLMTLLNGGLLISSVNFMLKYVLNAVHRNWSDALSALGGVAAFALVFFSAPPPHRLEWTALGWAVGETTIFIIKLSVLKSHPVLRRVRLAPGVCITLLLWGFIYFVLGG